MLLVIAATGNVTAVDVTASGNVSAVDGTFSGNLTVKEPQQLLILLLLQDSLEDDGTLDLVQ